MRKILFAILATALLISCVGRPNLNGNWTISSVDGELINQREIHPYINFDKATGRFHGNSGVNIINGTFTATWSKLKFDNLSTTMMAGSENDMEIESDIIEAINSAAKFRGKNGNVEILDDDGDVVLVLTR